MAVTIEGVRKLALSFPGVEEGPCYGTPGFRVRGKFLSRVHQDGESLVLKMDLETRAFLTRVRPKVFYFTDHYKNYPAVLIRLAKVTRKELEEHFEDAWRKQAPKKLIAEYDKSLSR